MANEHLFVPVAAFLETVGPVGASAMLTSLELLMLPSRRGSRTSGRISHAHPPGGRGQGRGRGCGRSGMRRGSSSTFTENRGPESAEELLAWDSQYAAIGKSTGLGARALQLLENAGAGTIWTSDYSGTS